MKVAHALGNRFAVRVLVLIRVRQGNQRAARLCERAHHDIEHPRVVLIHRADKFLERVQDDYHLAASVRLDCRFDDLGQVRRVESVLIRDQRRDALAA